VDGRGGAAVTDLAGAAADFRDLAKNLALVGNTELRRELYKAISDAAKPLAAQIKDPGHLEQYMPKRYAAVLAGDLSVRTFKRTGLNPGVTINASAPTAGRGGRKVVKRDEGHLTHPVFGRGPRRSWAWEAQERGMRPGFFTVPAERSAPRVRAAILDAMAKVAREAVGGR
jgi:hypothetical protein